MFKVNFTLKFISKLNNFKNTSEYDKLITNKKIYFY